MAYYLASDSSGFGLKGNPHLARQFQKWINTMARVWKKCMFNLALADPRAVQTLILNVKENQWKSAFDLMKSLAKSESLKDAFTNVSSGSYCYHALKTELNIAVKYAKCFEDVLSDSPSKESKELYTMPKYEAYKAKNDEIMMNCVAYGMLRRNPPSEHDLAITKIATDKKSNEAFARIGT